MLAAQGCGKERAGCVEVGKIQSQLLFVEATELVGNQVNYCLTLQKSPSNL
jgi:hypothetical protein